MKVDVYIAQRIINFLTKYKAFREARFKDLDDYKWLKRFDSGRQKFLYNLTKSSKIYLYKDSILSRLIFDGFEKNEDVFITKFLKKEDIFLDIGANIGLHTLIASEIIKDDERIYSFEPTPNTFERLRENIIENGIEKSVRAFQLGLSDKNEILEFNISTDGYEAWNSFAKLIHVPLTAQIQVQVIRLDDFVQQNNISQKEISLIKIDVEGWELSVLRGMDSLFGNKEFNPCFLIEFTEENVFRAGYSCKDLYDFMVNKGFKWYTYDAIANSVSPSELRAYYPYENLIASKDYDSLIYRLQLGK